MFKFFRKIRQQLLSQNRFSKYLIYAVGEIVLVVLGILIALYVNNSNQKQKDLITINRLFQDVLDEVQTNIKECDRVLQYEKSRDSTMQLILQKKLSYQDYKYNPYISNTIIYAFDLDTKSTAYQNLVNRSDKIPDDKIILFNELSFLYNDPVKDLDRWNALLLENALRNERNWSEKYEWFPAVINETYSEEATNYFLTNPYYINEVLHYQSYHNMQKISAYRLIQFGLEFYSKLHKAMYPNKAIPEWTQAIKNHPDNE